MDAPERPGVTLGVLRYGGSLDDVVGGGGGGAPSQQMIEEDGSGKDREGDSIEDKRGMRPMETNTLRDRVTTEKEHH